MFIRTAFSMQLMLGYGWKNIAMLNGRSRSILQEGTMENLSKKYQNLIPFYFFD